MSNDACKCAINFSPSAESILKMLIYYMLKDDWPPQSDWSRCHLIFFSLDLAWTWWMMIDFPQGSDIWWKSWKIYFCMYSPMMHAYLPQTFSPTAESHLKMLIYYIFSCKCRFVMAVMHVNIEGNPIKDMNAKLTYLSSGSVVERWLTLPIWLTRMSPKIFQFWFSLDMLKDDWPSLPGSDIWWKSW